MFYSFNTMQFAYKTLSTQTYTMSSKMTIVAFEDHVTKTSRFLNILIKFGVFPVTIENDKIQSKIFSLKTILHLIFVNGIAIFCVVSTISDYQFQFQSTSQWISVLVVQPSCVLFMNLSLVIALGLDNVDKTLVTNPSLQWPKQGLRMLFGMILYDAGMIFGFCFVQHSLDQLFRVFYFSLTLLCMNTMFVLAPFLIAVFMETFKFSCQKARNGKSNFFNDGEKCILQYEKLSMAFEKFFFCFFVSNQFVNIFYVYYILSHLLSSKVFFLNDLLIQSSSILNTLSTCLGFPCLILNIANEGF